MMLEKIQIYCPNHLESQYTYIHLPSDSDRKDIDEVRELQGYLKIKLTDPCYYTENSFPLIESHIYYNEQGENITYIVEIWGPHERYVKLFCKSELDFFHLTERIIGMMKNMSEYERNMCHLKKEMED